VLPKFLMYDSVKAKYGIDVVIYPHQENQE